MKSSTRVSMAVVALVCLPALAGAAQRWRPDLRDRAEIRRQVRETLRDASRVRLGAREEVRRAMRQEHMRERREVVRERIRAAREARRSLRKYCTANTS